MQFHGEYISTTAAFYNQPSIDGSIQSGVGSKGALLKGQYTTPSAAGGRNGVFPVNFQGNNQ